MLVFDVGANVGIKAQSMRGKGARVVCFEPQPDCALRLLERFSRDPDVIVVQEAMGRVAGVADLSVCDQANTISTMSDAWKQGRFKGYDWNRTITVKVSTLEAAIVRFGQPDYCKIDVEGFELDVLMGLETALPLLSFEFTKEFEGRAADCARRLQAIGFVKFNLSYGETQRFKQDTWMDIETLIAELAGTRHAEAWGDIFAARGEVPQDILALVLAERSGGADDDTLEALLRAGLAYPGSPLRLHLGCGETLFPGYVNIDYPQDRHDVYKAIADYQADVTTLRFPENSVDEIRLHHVFEHFNRTVALAQIIKWHHWLKVEGRLVIETPDFEASAADVLRSTSLDHKLRAIRHLEGDQASGWAYHVGQWFPDRFFDTLTRLGFSEIVVQQERSTHRPPLFNVVASATKLKWVSLEVQYHSGLSVLRQFMVAQAEQPTFEVWAKQLTAALGGDNNAPTLRHPLPAEAPNITTTADLATRKERLLREFRDANCVRHNQRRQEHLASLGLPIEGRTVLELGAGIGDHTQFFIDRDCSICVSDGRPELYEIIKDRYHWMRTELLDLEGENPDFNDVYDIVYAYGLLYHLKDPARALMSMARWCGSLLLLETCVSPLNDMSINPASEQKEYGSQAVSGTGCRPSRPWIFAELKELFAHVYCTATQPWHPEFPLDWDSVPADAGLTRAVFVANRTPLDLPTLLPSLPRYQKRH